MEVLIVILLVAILFVLVRGQRTRHAVPASKALGSTDRQQSRLELVSANEHALGIRPCSRPGCPDCRLYVARVTSGRRPWRPHDGGPGLVDGTIAAVETVPRYGTQVRLYYLDPLVNGDPSWTIEASHVVLANELARFRVGDRVRIRYLGPRLSRRTGSDYYLYDVQLLP